MKEFGDGFDLCHFSTLINIVAETAIVSTRTLPVGLPLPTISKNSLYTLFCPWILVHGVSFILSIPGAKIPISYLLLDTSFHHHFQSVDNQVPCSSVWFSRSYNSNTVLSFSDSRILNLSNPSKMSSSGIFVIDNKIPSHFESNSCISSFRRTIVNRSV